MRRLFERREDDNTLEEQLLNESGAMVKYASAAGRRIPSAAALTVSRLILQRAEHGDGSPNAGWRPIFGERRQSPGDLPAFRSAEALYWALLTSPLGCPTPTLSGGKPRWGCRA